MSTIALLQQSLPTGIKDIKHLHVVLMAIDYALNRFDDALNRFDDEHCQSIATIVTNMNFNNPQPVAL